MSEKFFYIYLIMLFSMKSQAGTFDLDDSYMSKKVDNTNSLCHFQQATFFP